MDIGYLADAAVALLAVVGCLRAARKASPRGALAWRCQAVAAGTWALHGVLQGVLLPELGPDRVVGALDDVLVVAFPVLVFAGMSLTSRAPRLQARARVLLDACTATAAVLALQTAFASVEPTTPAGGLLLLRPVPLLLLALYYLLVMVTEIPVRRWVIFLLLSSAMLVASASESATVVPLVTGRVPDPVLVHGGWLLCFALMAAAGLAYRGTSVRRSTPPTSWLVSLAPVVLVVPAAAVLVLRQLTLGRLDAPDVAAAVVLVVLGMFRQVVTALENRDLLRRLAASESALRHRADHDVLTGAPNRGLLVERLEAAVLAGPVGVLLIDLDGFKQVNDEFGHEIGDALLVEVARRLQVGVREGDTSARLGGDEFAVVVPGLEGDTDEIAARLVADLGRPYALGEVVVDHVGASVGTAWRSGQDAVPAAADDLLRRADAAMYRAKRDGGARSAPSVAPLPAAALPH